MYRYVDTRSISAMGVLLVAFGYLLSCLVFHITVVTIVLGVIVGLGQGMMYFSNAIIINQYFLKNRVSGNGIYFAGGTLGSFFVPPILFKVVNWCGLRYTFLILGALACNGWAASILLKSPLTMMKEKQRAKEKALESARPPTPEEIRAMPAPPPPYEEPALANGSNTKGSLPLAPAPINTSVNNQEETYAMEDNDFMLERVYRIAVQFNFLLRPIYSMIVLSGIAFSFSFVIYPVTAVDFVKEKGYGHSKAALILTTFSIGDISGRLFVGSISDRRYLERDTMMACIYLIWALGWAIFPMCETYEQLVPASVILGFGIGCGTPLYTVLLADYLGVKTMPLTFGVYRMILGMISLARPYCIGYFRDTLRSYPMLYMTLAGYAMFISVMWAFHAFITRARTRTFKLSNTTINDPIKTLPPPNITSAPPSPVMPISSKDPGTTSKQA
ncbi:monocarboxylate transporter 12-like [Tropilaelaps mercedesae]|uniref:Monocarboxylate transporter 12-like n=1 Tax=Tropilaelaps mercedesae TaxID=418985 RepID=A0A1V9XLK8_9ACAR|nr:monocarboxylate transporter 12-like [Tropilaelaps mercedesae]